MLACFQEGSTGSPTFDPVAIAHHLQKVADKYNVDLNEPVRNIIAETANKQVEKFGETVESLIKTWPNPYELPYEKAFLVLSVKLFVHLAQKVSNIAPNLLTRAINGNPEVRQYIESQGGWENFRG
ncbi:hypothetical protein lerEdw1_001740 [Lerista edwardsae]|nr:hypothetical protein lerEdw1_001740 [Lerista edwardsae]